MKPDLLKLVYAANMCVTAWIGITSLFYPRVAAHCIFTNAYSSSEYIRLVGCLWLGIFVLSLLGWWKPLQFSAVLVLQFVYKLLWLSVVALPAALTGKPYPRPMALFFLIWVIVIPTVLPWDFLFGRKQ